MKTKCFVLLAGLFLACSSGKSNKDVIEEQPLEVYPSDSKDNYAPDKKGDINNEDLNDSVQNEDVKIDKTNNNKDIFEAKADTNVDTGQDVSGYDIGHEAGKEGGPCRDDGSCDKGLMCALEGVCLNAKDFNSGDMGQKCRTLSDGSEFCYPGLTCNNFGECELDCSPKNNSLCTQDGNFDLSPYVGRYKLTRFEVTTKCDSVDYHPEDPGFKYFELTMSEYYGFKYLSFHTCESAGKCSDTEKIYYKIVDVNGRSMMEYATEHPDGSCTYTQIDTYIRKYKNKIRIRYVFNQATLQNSSDECSSSNVDNHLGDMSCSKIRIIDGVHL